MTRPLRVLIVEDSKADAELLLIELKDGGYDPVSERVDTAEAMSEALDRQTWDIILCDYVMPEFDGLAALKSLQAKGIDIPFIVVSGQIGEDIAVATMKAGASDYILKGHYTRLVPAVERELREAIVRHERRQAKEERARLAEQLRDVNEQLVLSNVRYQEQAEEAGIRAAELTAVIDSMAEAVVICDPDGAIVRMNPVAADLFGLSPDGSRKSILDQLATLGVETTDGRSFPRKLIPLARALRGEAARGVVMIIHRPSDGRPVWVSSNASPLLAPDGKLKGAVATFEEIPIRQR